MLTGRTLAAMDDAALRERVGEVQVFARVDPVHKLRIVRALQQQGHVVAMTGDGVNDAPALKAADIGVAMGLRGTDVAREAAALVLLDDNFASLVEAVRAGRRIFANLRKALGYLFAVHVPIVGMALIPVVMGEPVLLLRVVLLELLIDPACSLVFEAEPPAADSMRQPPRGPDDALFSLGSAARARFGRTDARGRGAGAVGFARARGDAGGPAHREPGRDRVRQPAAAAVVPRRGVRHVHANSVFVALLAGVCAVWLLLTVLPGVGSLFGLPQAPSAWVLCAVAPAGWALWHLSAYRSRT